MDVVRYKGKGTGFRLSQNKALEVSVHHTSLRQVICVELTTRGRDQDHAGVHLELTVLGVGGEINFYDVRHAEDRK